MQRIFACVVIFLPVAASAQDVHPKRAEIDATIDRGLGFLVKDTPPAEIVRAIELVASGESMLSPTVTRRLIDRLAGEGDASARHAEAAGLLQELSPRERQIAGAIARGKSNAAIAAELHLSVATIKSNVSAMLATLQLDNRVQIALLVQDANRA